MSAFDYAKPFDIMVGHWVGTASVYGPTGAYLLSTKSYVSIYWYDNQTLSFRESAEDDFEFQACRDNDYIDPRGDVIASASEKAKPVAANDAARVLTYDFNVRGRHCTATSGLIWVNGRQTRPDAYQFHVKIKKNGHFHHAYNSHHIPSPDDWHIIGPIVGRVNGIDGEIGLAVVQNFRRISYSVPRQSVRPLAKAK